MIMAQIAMTLLIIVRCKEGKLVAFACGGSGSRSSRVIYTLVGLSAVWCISLLFRDKDPVEERS